MEVEVYRSDEDGHVTWSAEWGLRAASSGEDSDEYDDLGTLVDVVLGEIAKWTDRYRLALDWEVCGDKPQEGSLADEVARLGVTSRRHRDDVVDRGRRGRRISLMVERFPGTKSVVRRIATTAVAAPIVDTGNRGAQGNVPAAHCRRTTRTDPTEIPMEEAGSPQTHACSPNDRCPEVDHGRVLGMGSVRCCCRVR